MHECQDGLLLSGLMVLLTAAALAAPVDRPGRGAVPPGFMLYFSAPGVEPGEPGDDQGPPRAVRRQFAEAAGCNVGEFTIAWGDTQPNDPGDGPPTYDFSRVRPPEHVLQHEHLICHLLHFANGWAGKYRFADTARYNELLAGWAEAACRFARDTYGVELFETGGNERDLVDPATYRPHYPDWHFLYMDPIKAMHRGMKRAHAENRLIIGNLCYSDRDHISALYDAGAKDNFEMLAIHAYGPRGCHVDMEQVIESHQEMAHRGDPDIPILVSEGWSSMPIPPVLEKDPRWRREGRPYTPREIEHYRQAVLDGWRNLTTPRPGYYDPAWVIGARFFVLNDHWGARGWAQRARPDYDEDGQLKGFRLDGYWIGTSDPDFIKPFLRPWGLIDINGEPKGDIIQHFPPYIPKHRFVAALDEDLPSVGYDPGRPERTCPEVAADRPYHATVEFTNLEATPLSQCHVRLSEKNDADFPDGYAFGFEDGVLNVFTDQDADRLVRANLLSGPPPDTIAPGQTVRLRYEITFSPKLATNRDDGSRRRVRPYADLYYIWQGRPYHTDAWLPRVTVRR